MRFSFSDAKLRALYTTGKSRYSPEVSRAFFRVMGHVDQAVDERDLYNLKGLHYEKLKGDRKGQHSLRLNQQFRLIVRREDDSEGRLMRIIEIVDYH
jgi:proteic killer suppression protein